MSIESPELGNERVFAAGETVRVQRSTGEMEDGWRVLGTIPAQGNEPERVALISANNEMKNPSVATLREWNP